MLQCFFFPFLLWLKEQQAVTAPWALTDHSLQSGWQRCRPGSATLHKGLWERCSGWVKRQRRARCETAPSSAQSLLLDRRLFTFRGGSEEKASRGSAWIHAGFIPDVSRDNNTGSLLSNSNRETLAKICLSQDLILNKLPWSLLYCNIYLERGEIVELTQFCSADMSALTDFLENNRWKNWNLFVC